MERGHNKSPPNTLSNRQRDISQEGCLFWEVSACMCSCWQKYTAPCPSAAHQKNFHPSKVEVPLVSPISVVLLYTIPLTTGKKQLGMQAQCRLLRELSKLTLIWEGRVCLGFFRLPLSCSCHYVKRFLIPCQGVQACKLATNIYVMMPQKLIRPQMRKAFK